MVLTELAKVYQVHTSNYFKILFLNKNIELKKNSIHREGLETRWSLGMEAIETRPSQVCREYRQGLSLLPNFL